MRALLRLTGRSLRRLVRTNLLIVVLIALSVAAGVYSTVIVRSDEVTARDEYLQSVGTSDFRLRHDAHGGYGMGGSLAVGQGSTADDVAAGWDEVVTALEDAGGSVFKRQIPRYDEAYLSAANWNYTVSDADLDELVEREVVLDIEGRTPEKAGEVAISRRWAAEANLTVGDTTTSVSGAEVTVVGLVRHRPTWADNTVYVPRGLLPGRDIQQLPDLGVDGLTREQIVEIADTVGLTEYEDGDGFTAEFTPRSGDVGQYELIDLENVSQLDNWVESSGEPAVFGALTAAALLVQTALISAVAFVVSIRRRTQDIGRLTAIGASPRQLYQMFILEAAALGIVGAIGGCVLGVAVAYAQHNVIVPRLLGDASLRVVELDVQLGDLIAPGLFAVAAAVLAMAIPAMWATSLSPEKARNDGYGPVSVSTRLASLSAGIFAFGCLALLVMSRLTTGLGVSGSGWFMKEVVLVLSGLPILVGTAGLVYVAMQALHQRASVLPLRLRFSSRDALRNPIRSVGAVIAFMALLMVVTTATTAQAPRGPYPVETRPEIFDVRAEGAVAQSSVFPPIDVANPEDTKLYHPPEIDPDLEIEGERLDAYLFLRSADSGGRSSDHFDWLEEPLQLVATDDVVVELNVSSDVGDMLIEGSQLVLLTGAPERVPPSVVGVVDDQRLVDESTFRVEVVQSDLFGGWPVLLVPPPLVEREGLATIETRLLYNDEAFTSEQKSALYRFGYHDMSFDPVDDWSPFQNQLVLMVPVVLFILVVSRILSALSGADSGADIATMISVGAPVNFRRSQLAWQMAYCASFAVVAALPAGLIAGWIYALGSLDYRFGFNIPLGVVVGSLLIPALAWVLIFTTTRRGQANVSHRLV